MENSGGVSLVEVFLIGTMIVAGGFIVKAIVNGEKKDISSYEEKEEEKISYSDFEKELKDKFKNITTWDDNRGIYSIYLGLSKELLEAILDDLDNVSRVIEDFKSKKCNEIRNIKLDTKFNEIEAINFESYFRENGISSGSFTHKVVELAKSYCNEAVENIKNELETALKYNDKEFIKEKVEKLLKNF